MVACGGVAAGWSRLAWCLLHFYSAFPRLSWRVGALYADVFNRSTAVGRPYGLGFLLVAALTGFAAPVAALSPFLGLGVSSAVGWREVACRCPSPVWACRSALTCGRTCDEVSAGRSVAVFVSVWPGLLPSLFRVLSLIRRFLGFPPVGAFLPWSLPTRFVLWSLLLCLRLPRRMRGLVLRRGFVSPLRSLGCLW